MANRKIDERTKYQLVDRLPEYLDATGRSSRKPFRCINPAHADKNPSMSYDRESKKAHCFSCGVNYDIFDVIGIDTGAATFPEQYNRACDYFNIAGDPYEPEKPVKESSPAPGDYTAFYARAHKDIDKTPYHRGLTRETLDRFNIGFVEAWKHPKRSSDSPSPRLIIPTSPVSYTARYTGNGDFIGYNGTKMNKGKVGNVHIFNVEALASKDKPVFIVEGEIDAMSIEQCGFPAIATGSISNIRILLEEVKANKPAQPLIIALDNEDNPATRKAENELAAALEKIGVSSYRRNFYGKYKDANEFLQASPDGLREALSRTAEEVESIHEDTQETEAEAYKRENCVASLIKAFTDGIAESVATPAVATGFPEVDKILDGGFYPGLYTMGAITGLGKTTFALQVADNIARGKHDVLIFSLEMARSELMSKSISRHTFLIADDSGRTRDAKTARGITAGAKWLYYSAAEKQLIKDATAEYSSYAPYLYIIEGMGEIGVREIREQVQNHITLTGNKPIVIIDYLQILAPYEPRSSDKQNTDKAILELKRMSRDFMLPVIAISSFNRENYTAPVNLAALKESGAIEYGSDVIIGLQYKGMDYTEGEGDDKRKKRIRELLEENDKQAKEGQAVEVQLKILKNRHGGRGSVFFSFYPMFNYYEESIEQE